MRKIFISMAVIILAIISLFAVSVNAAVTEVKNIENVGIYTATENVGFEVTRDNAGEEYIAFKVYDIDGNLIKESRFTAKQQKQKFSLGYFKNGWYRVKIFVNDQEENIFASFSVVDERDGFYYDSPFAIMHLGRLVGSSKDTAYAEALAKLSVGTVRTDEIADIHMSARPYEKYNTNLTNVGIRPMATVSTNYTYPNSTTTGNVGGFTELFDVYDVHKTMVKAYNGKVPYWELINEPDINKSVSADAFASWYKAAAIGISDAQPSAMKSFGGLCVTNSQYFDIIMQNGIMDYSDTINVHSHATDSADGINYNGTLAEMGKVYSALYADNAPLWSTESGVRMTVVDGTNELPSEESLRRQARYMITSFMETVGEYGINKNFWFLTSHYVSEGPEYGTFSKNDMPYPAINSLNVLTDNLKDGKLLGRLNGVEDTKGYFFDCGDYDAAVIWRTKEGRKNIQLHANDNVTIVGLVGNANTKVYSPSTGRVSFYVTEDPILVRFSQKADCEDYVKTAFETRLPVAHPYTDTAERVVLQQIWDPKPDIYNGVYSLKNNTVYTVRCRIYNFNDNTVDGTFGFRNSDGIIVSGETTGAFSVAGNSYVEEEITVEVSNNGTNFSFENLEFYAETRAGCEIAPSISQVRIQNEQNTSGADITVIEDANYYSSSRQGDYYSSQVSPSTSNSWIGNSVKYSVRNLKNSDVPAQLYIYQSNLTVNSDSEGMYFKFNCDTFPSSFEKAYFDVMVFGDEGSFYANNLFEFNSSTKNKNVFIPWSAFVHSGGNVGITDPSKINRFGFGFDLSSSTGYSLAFTISDMGTYKSQVATNTTTLINVSGIADGEEYRLKDAKVEIESYDPENTEIYVNYEKIECDADESGVYKLDFSEYEPGDYSLIVAVSDEFNKKNYKKIDFSLMQDLIYFR